MSSPPFQNNWLVRNRQALLYGVSLALVLLLLNLLQFRLLVLSHALELYIGLIALIFTTLGIWLAYKLMKPRVSIETRVIEKEVPVRVNDSFSLNENEMNKLGLSLREIEVLELMGKGLSNQEIATRLFVSLNTVKTHSSKLFEKLDVKRRTQAVEKGRLLGLIP